MTIRLSFLAAVLSAVALGADGAQQFYDLGDFRLQSGETIRACRIGYRTFGTLNADKSNAVLFPTWFSGTAADLAGQIGADKLVDPARYFVIAVDAIGNGVSSSPSNSRLQPRLRFPKFGIRDMVESQYRLVTGKLGLRHLHAVMGISMGGMQTFEWMVAHPDFFDRAVPIVGSTRLTVWDLRLWQAEKDAIEADAAWKRGNYRTQPRAALRTVAGIHDLALSTPAHYLNENGQKAFAEILAAAEKASLARLDANNWYRQLEAMMAHDIARGFAGDMARAATAVKARTLVVVGTQDHMVHPGPALDFARRIGARTLELSTDCGHLAPGCEMPKVGAAIAEALR